MARLDSTVHIRIHRMAAAHQALRRLLLLLREMHVDHCWTANKLANGIRSYELIIPSLATLDQTLTKCLPSKNIARVHEERSLQVNGPLR